LGCGFLTLISVGNLLVVTLKSLNVIGDVPTVWRGPLTFVFLFIGIGGMIYALYVDKL